jgi:hypothetical protein
MPNPDDLRELQAEYEADHGALLDEPPARWER